MTDFDADVIVVGSGPAGTSAAFPMLEAGMRVVLVDGGRRPEEDLLPSGAYHDLRRTSADQWRTFLGPRLEGLADAGPPSPKLRSPGARFAFAGFESQRITGESFALVGSLARGGLSAIWGAGLGVFDDDDLAAFPLTLDDLAPSYLRITERMGVSGFGDDDLASPIEGEIVSQPAIRLAENARRLAARYARRRPALASRGFRLGRSRVAVLSEPLAARGPCLLCDTCLFGCRHGAIWNAAYDLETLRRHPGLEYRPGWLVEGLEAAAGGYRLAVAGRGRPLAAPRVLLAAGALVSTRLVLELTGRFDEDVALLTSPAMAFALCLPERVASPLPEREFSLAQLSFVAQGPGGAGDRSYGNLFSASGIPGSFLVERIPVTRPAAVRLFRYLQPALLLANCYLPATFSANAARLEKNGEGASRLRVRGGFADGFGLRCERLQRQLSRSFRRLGALMLPGSFTSAEPGSDLRYGGTFPMRERPRAEEVDRTGELAGWPGLHLVDLSIFPAMPAKHPTLTLMANADRIGRAVAGRWKKRAPAVNPR